MKVAVAPEQVEVSIVDQGPGIPDIERALTEGFSTAPAAAREMGFGAGMGLPNIKRSSDRFSIHSKPNEGTRVRFTVLLQPHAIAGPAANSVQVDAGHCIQCLRCLDACPAQAIRLHHGTPQILEHACVDCTACAAACPKGVYGMAGTLEVPPPVEGAVLVLPTAALFQFAPRSGAQDVLDLLHNWGFEDVRLSGAWERALRMAVLAEAGEGLAPPVLSPVCPAVLNLIQARFPSLLDHVAPFLSPIEAAREELAVPHAVFVPACPAQHTVLGARSMLTRIEVAHPAAFCNAVLAHPPGRSPAHTHAVQAGQDDVLEIGGMARVIEFLDRMENGLMQDLPVVELYACEHGCFGAPVWAESPAVARRRADALDPPEAAAAIRRTRPLQARAGVRLDADMGHAIRMLSEINTLAKRLPGRDCGACGAPTCAALAEDTVMGRAELRACPYRSGEDLDGTVLQKEKDT